MIVAVNKIDRPGVRPNWAVEQVFDLFVSLVQPMINWIFHSFIPQPLKAMPP